MIFRHISANRSGVCNYISESCLLVSLSESPPYKITRCPQKCKEKLRDQHGTSRYHTDNHMTWNVLKGSLNQQEKRKTYSDWNRENKVKRLEQIYTFLTSYTNCLLVIYPDAF